jgi:hypothetical protein
MKYKELRPLVDEFRQIIAARHVVKLATRRKHLNNVMSVIGKRRIDSPNGLLRYLADITISYNRTGRMGKMRTFFSRLKVATCH